MITIAITEYMVGYTPIRIEYECIVRNNDEPIYVDIFQSRRRAWKSAKRVVRQLKEQ